MKSLVHMIVRRMREEGQPLSRNKHFATFAEPEGRAALRINRLLRSLEHDLGRHGTPVEIQIAEDPERGEIRLELRFPTLRASRTTYLSREALEILLESEVGRRLRQARWIPGDRE